MVLALSIETTLPPPHRHPWANELAPCFTFPAVEDSDNYTQASLYQQICIYSQ